MTKRTVFWFTLMVAAGLYSFVWAAVFVTVAPGVYALMLESRLDSARETSSRFEGLARQGLEEAKAATRTAQQALDLVVESKCVEGNLLRREVERN